LPAFVYSVRRQKHFSAELLQFSEMMRISMKIICGNFLCTSKSTAVIGKPKQHVHKASHCGNSLHQTRSLFLLLVWASYIWCWSSCTFRAWWTDAFSATQATIELTQWDHSIIACLNHIWCCSSHTFRSWWTTHSAQSQRRGCNNIPSFLQQTTPIACSLCEGCTWHDLHILVTAPFCCDQKVPAACAQSFALWQQATIEITCQDHSIIACSRHLYRVTQKDVYPW